MTKINECRICGSSSLKPVLNLGEQPWGNGFLILGDISHEKKYPLHLIFCTDCGLAQIDFTVSKGTMFADHTYLSGITESMQEHFTITAGQVDNFFGQIKRRNVLDIGSNDGTQLIAYRNLGYDVLGVEPSLSSANIAEQVSVKTIVKFFDADLASEINEKFQIINASGVFFHLEDLHSVTDGVRILLDDDGVFVVQCLYMQAILENGAFDQIYHEHLLFYTLQTLDQLLKLHGLELFDAQVSSIHGGSLICFAGHKGRFQKTSKLRDLKAKEHHNQTNELITYANFSQRVQKGKIQTVNALQELKNQGKTIYGLGAPVKGNTLLNYFDIGTETLDLLLERNHLRRNTFSPGKHIPIKIEDELKEPPDVYFCLAWNFKQEILKRHAKDIDNGVEFMFSLDLV